MIFSAVAALAWIAVIFCVPETRYERSKDELGKRKSPSLVDSTVDAGDPAGKHVYTLISGETRPRLDPATYGPRTASSDLGIFNIPILWKKSLWSLLSIVRCFFFPPVLWATMVSAIMAGATSAMGQTSATILITAGWKFENLGLAGLAVIVAAPFIWLVSGWLADRISNHVARRRGGRREPENHLINIVVPAIFALTGFCVYGFAAENIARLPSAIVLVGKFLVVFGVVCTNTTLSVFLVESYPNFAG